MFAQFRYLDGARAGETKAVGNDFATIGRHPTSDVGFDAERDLEVSMRHAAVFKQGGGFLIRDLGSTNGTFLNGQRVRGDRPLEPKDVIQLGPTGPKVEFTTTPTMPIAPRSLAPRPAPEPPPSTEIYRPRARTTDRIGIDAPAPPVRRPWAWVVAAIVIVGAGAASVVAARGREARAALEQKRTALLARLDDQVNRLGQATTSIAGLATALATARTEVTRLRAAIAGADLTAPRLDSLDRALIGGIPREEALLRTARLDPAATTVEGRKAVAVVIGEIRGAEAKSGTGFAIKRVGDTVWVAAPKRLVVDSTGRPAIRIAVIFGGATQAHLATLVGTHRSADIAVLATVLRTGAPTAPPLGDSVAPGDAVSMVGFPFGADSLGSWRTTGATATPAVGTVVSATETQIDVEGYGAPSPPGSPLFAGSGEVVGMVTSATGGRWTAVPIRVVRQLLDGRR